ncbi:MAG: DNA primase [Syntrophorhabdus sp. PtaU1.Bin153]|nr:MAG: DNA primase [Syntrophorhabdus sp. PtaU1.Bin153]
MILLVFFAVLTVNSHCKPNIVDEIEKIIPLHRSGKYLVGKCPLPGHDDRTPSFTVNPERQAFYCFGCHARGDVIEFVRLYHGFSFNKALEFLGISTRTTPGERTRLIGEVKKQHEIQAEQVDVRKEYAAELARWLRHYYRLIGLWYGFWHEGDDVEAHLPELLRRAESMEEAEMLVSLVRFANKAREFLFGGDQWT